MSETVDFVSHLVSHRFVKFKWPSRVEKIFSAQNISLKYCASKAYYIRVIVFREMDPA